MDHAPKDGEDRATWFGRIVRENHRYLYVTAYRVLRNEADAQDAVQAGVLKGYRRLESLDSDASILRWLGRIVHHVAIDACRKGGKTKITPVPDPAQLTQATASDTSEGIADDERRLLLDAIERLLPDGQAEVIMLRHFEGLEPKELAAKLGIRENTARVRLFRAYERLRSDPRVRRGLGMPEL
jgi:RNA polymerase sigma-70 factor (ECF subfamily)